MREAETRAEVFDKWKASEVKPVISSKSDTGSMTKEDILAKTQEAFHEAFSVEPSAVSLQTRPDDVPGWDSLGQLALATSLEKIFGITLDVDDLMEMETVGKIVSIIESKQKSLN